MSAATYYRQKAGMYQAKIRNLQRGGGSSVVCAVAGQVEGAQMVFILVQP
jgi:hypothetical protein